MHVSAGAGTLLNMCFSFSILLVFSRLSLLRFSQRYAGTPVIPGFSEYFSLI